MDTAGAFKDARVQDLEKLGISRELYEKTYTQARNGENGLSIYSNRRHSKVLSAYGFDEKQVLENLNKTLKSEVIKKYLYSDAIKFFKNLKKLGKKMILLSLGNPDFQAEKIKALDLEKYFDRVILTNEKKVIKLKEILDTINDRPAWFINDRIVENLEAKKLFPELKIVQTVFPFISEAEYKSTGLPYFNTLTEIYDFIAKSIK